MVMDEYREPTHEEFKDSNGWCLFNAFTEVLKKSPSQDALQRRTIRLHSVFDEFCNDAIEYEQATYVPQSVEIEDLDALDIAAANTQRELETNQSLFP